MREWLIAQRKNMALTQMAVAEMAGISRAYYAQLESDQRDPSIKVAIKLARLLELEWTSFYEDCLNDPE